MNCKHMALSFRNRFSDKDACFWCAWLGGVFLGFAAMRVLPSAEAGLVIQALRTPVSFFPLLFFLMLPLLIGWISVHYRVRWILLTGLLGKGIVYGFLLGSVFGLAVAPSWIIPLAFLFSDTVMLLPVLYLWRRCLRFEMVFDRHTVWHYLILVLIIVSMDYFGISPFIQRLFQ